MQGLVTALELIFVEADCEKRKWKEGWLGGGGGTKEEIRLRNFFLFFLFFCSKLETFFSLGVCCRLSVMVVVAASMEAGGGISTAKLTLIIHRNSKT